MKYNSLLGDSYLIQSLSNYSNSWVTHFLFNIRENFVFHTDLEAFGLFLLLKLSRSIRRNTNLLFQR